MSVSSAYPVIEYATDGVVDTFAYDFRIMSASDLRVYSVVNLVATEITSGFSVTGVGDVDGGELIFTSPPNANKTLRIVRATPLQRDVDYTPGPIQAEVLNEDADLLQMQIQDLDARVMRVDGAGNWLANTKRIRQLATPQVGTDAANKAYVDSVAMGDVDIDLDDPNLTGNITMTLTDTTDKLTIDHTASEQNPSVHIFHDNVRSNSPTPYLTNSVMIEATALNNNQPLLVLRKKTNTTSTGNSANLILENKPSTSDYADSDRFGVDLEFVTNNALINDYNGKFEIGVQSAQSSALTDPAKYGGYFYIASRRGPTAPEGANTGFKRFINIYQLEHGGEIESLGTKITVDPEYVNTGAEISVTNDHSVAEVKARSIVDYARVEARGLASTEVRAIADSGASLVTTQSADAGATLRARANWSNTGTGDSQVQLLNGADATDGWRIIYSQSSNNLIVQRQIASSWTTLTTFVSSDGHVQFRNVASAATGSIRLGDGSGSAGGGYLSYDSTSGAWDLSGTNATVTVDNRIIPRRVTSAPSATGDAGQAGDYHVTSTFLYFYVAGTGWVRTAVATF